MKYLEQRGLLQNQTKRKIWMFWGKDGEMDEPESMELFHLLLEEADNLIFVLIAICKGLMGQKRNLES